MAYKFLGITHKSICIHYYRYFLALLIGIALSLVFFVEVVQAVPVAPDELHFIQPNGVAILVTPFGDEWYSGYEYQGYTILFDRSSRYWVYAKQESDGRLVLGEWKAGIDKPPLDLLPHLRDIPASKIVPVTSSLLAPEVWPGASGAHKVLVILTDFTPSVSLGTSDLSWSQKFFDNTPGVKSIRNFYEQASFGNFSLAPVEENSGTANDGVIAVTLNYTHPNPYPTGDANRLITRNALLAADSFIDFSGYDSNGDGGIDITELHVMIIVRGFEKAYGGTSFSCSPSVWAHRWSLSGTVPAPTLDGVAVSAYSYGGGYTQQGEWHEFIDTLEPPDNCKGDSGQVAGPGIVAHELGHDIDWPDLYDTVATNQSAGVGYWSLMGSGNWGYAPGEPSGYTPILPDAFLKAYQGWITPIQITVPQSAVSLPNSAQNPVAYQVGINPKGIDWDYNNNSGTGEYFLIENRQLTGFDAGLFRIDNLGNAKGCIIWHIDETRVSNNTANSDESRRLVDVEEADGPPQDLDLISGGNQGDDGDPWPGSSHDTSFSAVSDPNSHWYDGSLSGVTISNISTGGEGCTLDFTGVGPTWDGSESSSWNAVDNWSVARVPNQNDNTVIPSGVSNWPDVNAVASVGNLNILDGAHLNATAGVNLDVYGNWSESGTGYFDSSAGTVVFRGNDSQSITMGTSSHFNNLQIGNGSTSQTVSPNSDLDVDGNLNIQLGATLSAGSHTLRVGGDWTDNPFGFDPGSSTVILDGVSQTMQKAASEVLVYTNDFTSTSGWMVFDGNSDSTIWYSSTSALSPNSPNHGRHARYHYNTVNAADDWLFSPGFTLQVGIPYQIRFNYGARSSSNPEKLAVYIGSSQNVVSMTTQLFDNNHVINTTWQPGSGTFTPSSSGTYYVGFHCYSDADMYELAFDDLLVAANDPILSFYNLSIASSGGSTYTSDISVQNNLLIDAGGILTLGANHLTIEGSVANLGSMAQTKTVNAASASFLNLKNGAGTVDKYFGATIDPGGTSLGSTTVTVRGNQNCPTANSGVKRCFDLQPETSQTATVTFYFTEAERNGVNASNAQAYHWSGSTWDPETGETTRGGSGDGQWVRVAGIDEYSPFTLHHSSPTAVAVTEFYGGPMLDGSVLLQWQTTLETNLVGFKLFRAESETGTQVQLNEELIPSKWQGDPMGDSYTFNDQTTVSGTTYYYWIEEVLLDGTSSRIGPISVTAVQGGSFVLYLPLLRHTE